MERFSNYREKYLKYKSKYLELKKYGLNGPKYSMKGGALTLEPVEQIPKMHDLAYEVQAYERYDQFKEEVDTLKTQFMAHKEAVNIGDKKSLTDKGNESFKEIHEQARLIALKEGMRLYTKWTTERSGMIALILKHFDDNGNVKPDSEPDLEPYIMKFLKSATWFNDLYKWTMYPVMRFIEKQDKFDRKPIHVKFQVDIRESTVREALEDPVVQTKVLEALRKLTDRTFEKDIFKQVSKEMFERISKIKGNIISDEDIDAICLKDGQPRKLVQVVSDEQYALVPEDGVVIRCFYDKNLHYDVPEKKEKEKEKEEEGSAKEGSAKKVRRPGLLVIEAEGPWHLVTWLETSMMQCVYETYLKHQLQEGDYQPWLSKALLRCATSVAYTRIMQMCGGPTPALFTGRRTGGLPFLILQNLFFVDHFKQFVPPTGSKPTISMYKKENEKLVEIPEIITEATACLGTSSVDAVLFLRTLLLEPDDGETRDLLKRDDPTIPNVLSFVGTHAHELSMVLSVLYHNLDVNPLKLPFSQVLGHYLYEELVRKKTLGLLPMLSDTLGTPAFVIAASILLLNNCVFLSFVNSARQDSGDLVDFEYILGLFEYKGGCMASEIDDTATLLKASLLTKYNTFGAGGYFGDSNKVYNERGINISMAVKVVRVECVYKEDEVVDCPPHITYKQKVGTLMCVGYPIKTGDSSNITDKVGRQQISKFSADKTLSDERLIAMKEYAISTREDATKMLFSRSVLEYTTAQIRKGVISISEEGKLIINTAPLQTLKLITEREKREASGEAQEAQEAHGGGKYKNKKLTRK
jgi:hypothetical protein